MTDMGRVLIVLGPPGDDFQLRGRYLDDRRHSYVPGTITWKYPSPASIGLTGAVVFAENRNTGEYQYDTQQGNVSGALRMAIRKAIVSPQLNEVPAWAAGTVTDGARQQNGVTASPRAAATLPPPPRVAEPPGARSLILTKTVMAINPRAASDPLASMTPPTSFTTQDDLGYALRYCVASYEPGNQPALRIAATISGQAGREKVNFVTPEDEVIPDAIKSLPGCYLVRGSLPLTEVGAGTYKLSLVLTDPATNQKYNLEQEFKIE
jgi:hypothetical protein